MNDVTRLLIEVRNGDRLATAELLPRVYEELRGLAANFLYQESSARTLQPTALVHEAFLRLVGPEDRSWENRRHFFGAAAKAMRRIILDHVRNKRRIKRGQGAQPIPIENADLFPDAENMEFLELDVALERLAELDPVKAQLVELRFFVGLGVDEVARLLDISPSTVAREWRFVRAWLHRELSGEYRE